MDKVKVIAILAFIHAIGIATLVGACAPSRFNYWPMFVVIFYLLSPFPILIWSRYEHFLPINSHIFFDLVTFLTSAIATSSFALPIILAHSPYDKPIIKWTSAGLVLIANVFIYTSLILFFHFFRIVNKK